jgi:hypothetical protein
LFLESTQSIVFLEWQKTTPLAEIPSRLLGAIFP